MQHFTTKAAISLDDFRRTNLRSNSPAGMQTAAVEKLDGEAMSGLGFPVPFRKLQRMKRHHEHMARLRLERAET